MSYNPTHYSPTDDRQASKVIWSQECLNHLNDDFHTFLIITPNTPVFKMIDDALSQFIETRLGCELTLHPLKTKADRGKYYVFLHNSSVYLVETRHFKHKVAKKYIEEPSEDDWHLTERKGGIKTDYYLYSSRLLKMPMLIDD